MGRGGLMPRGWPGSAATPTRGSPRRGFRAPWARGEAGPAAGCSFVWRWAAAAWCIRGPRRCRGADPSPRSLQGEARPEHPGAAAARPGEGRRVSAAGAAPGSRAVPGARLRWSRPVPAWPCPRRRSPGPAPVQAAGAPGAFPGLKLESRLLPRGGPWPEPETTRRQRSAPASSAYAKRCRARLGVERGLQQPPPRRFPAGWSHFPRRCGISRGARTRS